VLRLLAESLSGNPVKLASLVLKIYEARLMRFSVAPPQMRVERTKMMI